MAMEVDVADFHEEKRNPALCCTTVETFLTEHALTAKLTSGWLRKLPIKKPPELITKYYDVNLSGQMLLNQIRDYNNLLAMASLGLDNPPVEPQGGSTFMPTFKIHGKVYHRIGSFLLAVYAQLYFVDTENEMRNRLTSEELIMTLIRTSC
ncbi:Hypothetical predicted protein [Octopus vulgaris]|uniref:Uncharacterized protein n=1 Tax=Octopus vulgaris TaxID=6645 RepID=A0AA36F838_OCTVU|nr:Hypothetical predicted protein [Octopus vulgaris]